MADEVDSSPAHDNTTAASRGRDVKQRSRRRWGFRLLACGVPTVLGVAGIVALLIHQQRLVLDPLTGWPRFQSPPVYLEEPGHERTGHRYVYDAQLGWRNIPGWSATSLGRTLTINSHGLRDRERAWEPVAGVNRMLVLGDSYAWGYGVADDEIFSRVLEGNLGGTDAGWEVINSGVSGWGTDQELLYLTREGFRYRPQLVVLAFFLVNDPVNNMNARQYGLSKPLFLNTRLELGNTPVPLPGERFRPIRPEASAVELTAAIVQRMRDECRRHDCDLVVMKFGRFLFPQNSTYTDLDTELTANFEKLLPGRVLDLDDQFEARGLSSAELLEGNDDGHWNAFGHRVVAELLQEFLVDRRILAEVSTASDARSLLDVR